MVEHSDTKQFVPILVSIFRNSFLNGVKADIYAKLQDSLLDK